MGLKSGWNNFLRDTCPEVFEEIHISEYGFKKVAIDISLYMHKFKAVCGERWLSAFINLISSLRRNEIHCVFIFDGKAPPEKKGEQDRRRTDRKKMEKQLCELEQAFKEYQKTGVIEKILSDLYSRRRSPSHVRLLGKKAGRGVDMEWVEKKLEQRRNQLYDIGPDDFEKAKVLFGILKVPFYTAPWEAEKMCSKLCIDGKVDAVLSEDTDVMAYAAPVFLTKFDSSKDTCVRIQNNALMEGLELDAKQLLDLCIMCGTDYNPNIPRVGSKTAYKHILKHGSLDQITEKTNIDTSMLNYKRVIQLFTEFENYGLESIPFCGQPDFEKLQQFIIKYNVQVNIEKLYKDFIHNVIIYDDTDDDVNNTVDGVDDDVNNTVDYRDNNI